MLPFTELYSSEKNDIICHFVITEAFVDGIRSSENYHFHSRYELYAVKKGCMRIATDHREYSLGEGDIAIVPPRVTHYVYENPDSVRTGFLFDFIPSRKIQEGTLLSEFQKVFNPICDITVLNCPGLYDGYLSSAILAVADSEPRYAVEDLLFLTLDRVRRKLSGTMPSKTDVPKLSTAHLSVRIENYMNRTYAEHPDISALSDQLGYSVRQTQRIIERLFGMSFSQMLTKKRVAAACFLLKNTDMPLEEIAIQTGFCDLSHLCRAFRQSIGMTPLAYRRGFLRTEIYR